MALAVAFMLVSLPIGLVNQYRELSTLSQPSIVFSVFYVALIEVAGWWFVWWALRRR